MATERRMMKLYIPADDAEWLKAHAQSEGRTITGQMRVLIARYRAGVEERKVTA